ncbi:glycosyltransferase family 4 protein [Candidatus Sumerlaeota bacterium]|nr:glycosyltransferase family 4 protein [Candidatus Sumerlaeota bacterium]
MSDRKLLCIITPNSQTPSFRYRIRQYFPYLEKAGFHPKALEIQRLTSQKVSRFKNVFDDAGIIFLQKKLLNKRESSLISEWREKIVLDLDDALFVPAFNEPKGLFGFVKRFSKWNRFINTVQTCSFIICANTYLAQKCREAGNDNILILPTPVPLERYSPKSFDQPRKDPFILGWIGTPGNLRYLEPLRPVLAQLHKKFPVVLRIISSARPAITECPLEFKEWKLEEEAEDLKALDAGIMPLTDDPWTQGKAGFKLLQYMAAGLPSVSSSVGINKGIIQNGVNGFLAETMEQWGSILEKLAKDRELCKVTGANARATVEKHYSLDVLAPAILDFLHHFTGNRD